MDIKQSSSQLQHSIQQPDPTAFQTEQASTVEARRQSIEVEKSDLQVQQRRNRGIDKNALKAQWQCREAEVSKLKSCRAQSIFSAPALEGTTLSLTMRLVRQIPSITGIMQKMSKIETSLQPLSFSPILKTCERSYSASDCTNAAISSERYIGLLKSIGVAEELEFKGATPEEVQESLNVLRDSSRLKKCALENTFESFITHRPNHYQVPVGVKAEFHIEGRSSSHGIGGKAIQQENTSDCILSLFDKKSKYYCVGINSQHQLGAGSSGVNPDYIKVANVYLGNNQTQVPLMTKIRNKFRENKVLELRIPGGSSSGGTTAVAGRLVPAAVGSDGGGSSRICPALQGVIGVKGGCTSDGVHFFSLSNTAYEASSLVDVGVISGNMLTCAELVLQMSQVEPTDRVLHYSQLNVAIATDILGMSKSYVRKQTIGALKSLEDNRSRSFESLPFLDLLNNPNNARSVLAAFVVLFGSEELDAFEQLSSDQKRRISDELGLNVALAKTFTEEMIEKAIKIRTQLKERAADLKRNGVDVLVMPTTIKTARRMTHSEKNTGRSSLADSLSYSQATCFANLLQTSSITFGIGHDNKHNMPCGLMLTSLDEDSVNLHDLMLLAAEMQCSLKENPSYQMRNPDFLAFSHS